MACTACPPHGLECRELRTASQPSVGILSEARGTHARLSLSYDTSCCCHIHAATHSAHKSPIRGGHSQPAHHHTAVSTSYICRANRTSAATPPAPAAASSPPSSARAAVTPAPTPRRRAWCPACSSAMAPAAPYLRASARTLAFYGQTSSLPPSRALSHPGGAETRHERHHAFPLQRDGAGARAREQPRRDDGGEGWRAREARDEGGNRVILDICRAAIASASQRPGEATAAITNTAG